jgi:CRISPR-associated protein (TIGR03984 family)
MSCTLNGMSKRSIGLAAALQAVASNTALVGFCASPAAIFFVRWDGATLHPGDAGDLGQVYEARLFAVAGELRWLRDPENAAGLGSAAWLAETPLGVDDWTALSPLRNLDAIDGQRLLTGVLGRPGEAGWSFMNAPRHGQVSVPVAFPGKDAVGRRLAMTAREYLGDAPGSAGEDGNRLVVEERLLSIVVLDTTGG